MTDRGARGALVTLPSGLTLALCLFLPAIETCNQTYRPYAQPAWTGPYLFGFVAAAWAAARLVSPGGRAALGTGWMLWFLALFADLPLLVRLLEVEGQARRLVQGVTLALWCVPIAVLLLAPRRHRDHPDRMVARCLAAGAAQSLAWYHYWAWSVGPADTHFGFWLAIAASVGLLVGGHLLDRGYRDHQQTS